MSATRCWQPAAGEPVDVLVHQITAGSTTEALCSTGQPMPLGAVATANPDRVTCETCRTGGEWIVPPFRAIDGSVTFNQADARRFGSYRETLAAAEAYVEAQENAPEARAQAAAERRAVEAADAAWIGQGRPQRPRSVLRAALGSLTYYAALVWLLALIAAEHPGPVRDEGVTGALIGIATLAAIATLGYYAPRRTDQ